MKINKRIKKLLGLELPYLLEDEEEEITPIIYKNKQSNNIVSIPKNANIQFYKSEYLENIEKLSRVISSGGMTINEAREAMKKLGEINKK